jgi:schlafen family protein
MWSLSIIEEYIKGQIQESLNLEYKSARSLSRDDRPILEISKDVSAMANSQGGLIIYGIKEFDEEEKRHLPQKIEPIDQTKYTKEWLEQVINSNIHPRIQGIVIYPVQIDTHSNHCVYVLEIPQGNTAHQAKDKRYYRRYNFESIAMEDFEIRDIMNRASVPNVSIRFGLYDGAHISDDKKNLISFRGLRIIVKNEGSQVVSRFKVVIILTNVGEFDDDELKIPYWIKINNQENDYLKTWLSGNPDESADCHVIYQPQFVLFPQEELDIAENFNWGYADPSMISVMDKWKEFAQDQGWGIMWKLFADNMPFKEGKEFISDLPTLMPHS